MRIRYGFLLALVLLVNYLPSIAAQSRGATRSGGSVYVKGYTKKDGTYVPPHHRSRPDSNPNNNWSTKGNVNPYTGAAGTRNPQIGISSGARAAVSPPAAPVIQQPAPGSPTPSISREEAQTPTVTIVVSTNVPGERFGYIQISDKSFTDDLLEFQRKSADKGFAPSQYVMALRYLNGTGVARDAVLGRQLLFSAANQGHEKAKEKLRELRKQEAEQRETEMNKLLDAVARQR